MLFANRRVATVLVGMTSLLTAAPVEACGAGPWGKRLDAAWQAVLADTPRPATWAARRQAFAKMAAGQSAADRKALHDDQIETLKAESRYAQAMPRHIMPRQTPTIGRSCVGSALRNCKVLASGRLTVPNGPEIRWQTQRGFTNKDGVRGGVVLLERRSCGFAVIAWSFEGYDWESPRLIARSGETLLTVPGRVAGTGHHNADLLYRRAGSSWREIELESWKDDITPHLPDGFGVWKGVTYDFDAMTARTRVWRPKDANCCPTGGDAVASLRIDGERLVMTGLTYTAPSNAP